MSATTPLITVLLPCYNAMPYLREALESIIHQTYTNLEILCINDGSADETGEILEEYAAADKRITVIHNETNIKLIRSLNKGIALANGEYIARMDSDDIAHPERIQEEINVLLADSQLDLVATNVIRIDETGKIIRKKVIRQHSSIGCQFASLFYGPIYHATLLARKKLFEQFKFLEEPYALHTEDYELFSRMLRSGVKMKNIDKHLYFVRKNKKSVSQLYSNIQDANFTECVRRNLEHFIKKSVNTSTAQIVSNRMPKKIKNKDLISALKLIKLIRSEFVSIQTISLSSDEKRELAVVYYSYLFDICVQLMKKPTFLNKLTGLLYLLSRSHMFLYSNVRKYAFRKFS